MLGGGVGLSALVGCCVIAGITAAELRLSLEDESRQRCINITSPLGLIRLGQHSSSSASDACDYTTAH